MIPFGEKLSEIESKLLENAKKTKTVFPEETQMIETGLELMIKLTQFMNESVGVIWKRPNLVTNINLFARNRQLLLNAYLCWLNSSYGTQFVILRTILENNNLMRHFNDNYQDAFEWLSPEMQVRFAEDIRLKYGSSGKSNQTFSFPKITADIFDGGKQKVKKDILDFYGTLCNYTHPNFLGWQELFATTGQTVIILRTPIFQSNNAELSIAATLYLMQLSFKTFVETFKEYLDFKFELAKWQEKYMLLIRKY